MNFFLSFLSTFFLKQNDCISFLSDAFMVNIFQIYFSILFCCALLSKLNLKGIFLFAFHRVWLSFRVCIKYVYQECITFNKNIMLFRKRRGNHWVKSRSVFACLDEIWERFLSNGCLIKVF